jgi:hypothetical protein
MWDEYADEAHEIAVSKGWWDNDRAIINAVSLIHTEITEAYDALGKEDMIDGPDSVRMEMVDTALCILDLFGSTQHSIDYYLDELVVVDEVETDLRQYSQNMVALIADMHQKVSHAMEVLRDKGTANNIAMCHLAITFFIAYKTVEDILECDFAESLEAKMEINRDRDYRHGGKEA